MTYRIGLLVPSSNVTMESELPALFRRRERVAPARFTFHSARAQLTSVTPEALAAMNVAAERSAAELADADCDVLAYACLVAVMAAGPGAHRVAARHLAAAAGGADVVTSAGALVDGIRALGARRVAMITPYAPALTAKVVAYLAAEDIEVVDAISLNVTHNRAVGRLDPAGLVGMTDRLDLSAPRPLCCRRASRCRRCRRSRPPSSAPVCRPFPRPRPPAYGHPAPPSN